MSDAETPGIAKRRSPTVRAIAVGLLAVLGAMTVLVVVTPGIAGATNPPCTVTVTTENLANNAIQSAIDANPGGVICVGPGTFPEQLVISTSNTVLRGSGASSTVIEPNEPLNFNTYDYDSFSGPTGTPAAAIILVQGSSGDPTTGISGVTVENLQVNGLDGQSSYSNCSYDYFGVDFQASSGTLTHASVLNVALPESLFGCQDGQAVYAYNGYFNFAGTNNEPDYVTVSHTTVATYDKTGVLCDDPGETCILTSNTVTGIGPTDLIAQNGFQIGFGAYAYLQSNHVSENGVYFGAGGCTGTGQGYNLNCTGNEGAGILLYDSGSGTTASENVLSLNEYGIDYFDDGTSALWSPATVTIAHNTVDSSVAYGIVAEGAAGAVDTVTIHQNTVNNEKSLSHAVWGAPGILVDTGTFYITDNKVMGSSTSGSAGNGPSQPVCGPVGVFYVCSPGVNIPTAAIQGTSESLENTTWMVLSGNSYGQDSHRLATIGVLGGAVNVLES